MYDILAYVSTKVFTTAKVSLTTKDLPLLLYLVYNLISKHV